MATNHFNGLTEAEQERLAFMVEECCEVAAIGMKILRHGYESHNPDKPEDGTNRQMLEKEIGHVFCAYYMLTGMGDISAVEVKQASGEKGESARKYLHHQEGL